MQRYSRWFVLITLALWPLVLLSGCGGGGGGGGSTTVVGKVLDSRNGDNPVAGATVAIGGASATTIADGSFTIRGASGGATTATITAPGQQAQTIAFSPPVAASGSTNVGDLILNIGQIRGRVLTPQGQPAVGALVTVIATGDNVLTGADGRFQVDNIPSGTTDVTAVLGTASVTRQVTVGDGVTEIGDLTLVDDPNPNPPGQPKTIQGTITLSDGASATGLTVRLLRNGVDFEQAATNAAGGYEFYVPVGTYGLRVSKPGYQDATGQVTVTNPATPVQADLTLVKL